MSGSTADIIDLPTERRIRAVESVYLQAGIEPIAARAQAELYVIASEIRDRLHPDHFALEAHGCVAFSDGYDRLPCDSEPAA